MTCTEIQYLEVRNQTYIYYANRAMVTTLREAGNQALLHANQLMSHRMNAVQPLLLLDDNAHTTSIG